MGTPLVNIGLNIGLANIEKNSQILYIIITPSLQCCIKYQ